MVAREVGRDAEPAASDRGAPLRIVVVCAARRWTGGERALVTVANGLAARGHAVVFAYDPRGPVGDRLAAGVRAEPVVIHNDADPIAVLRLQRLIRAHRAEVVCVNTFRELKVGGAAARLAGRARVVNRRGSNDALYTGRRERLLYALLLDMVVRDSEAGRDVIRRENPWFRRPVLRARNGVDAAAIAAVEPVPRGDLGATADEVLVAVLDRKGRFAGAPDLAAAARLAVERGAGPIRLLVMGDVDPRSVDEVRRRLAGAEDGVRLTVLGARPPDQALQILAASDMMARPSRADALSYAVLEAMALGKPVVASAVGGLPEIVRDGATGVLVPPGDVAALATALGRLSVDPALRRRMGAAGRARVVQEFGEERMIDEYEAAFRQAAGMRASGAD